MSGERERRAAVVEYWRAVELFSPRKVPTVSSRERVYEVAVDRALPWEDGHPVRSLPLDPGYAWQHIVYGDCFALADVRDTLLEVFGRDEEDVDGRMDGDTALFALTVTDGGRLLLDSPVFSACGWATGRALSPGPGGGRWLDGFEEDVQPWLARAAELGKPPVPVTAHTTDSAESSNDAVLSAADDDDVGGVAVPQADSEEGDDQAGASVGAQRIRAEDLIGFTRDLAARWGVEDALRPFGLRIRTIAVREDRAEDGDQQDFLNSFIADDLKRVATTLPAAGPGTPLEAYLTPDAELNTARRIDLRVRPDEALAGVEPRATPLGRWPAESAHPLALSQQFAVNSIPRWRRYCGFGTNGARTPPAPAPAPGPPPARTSSTSPSAAPGAACSSSATATPGATSATSPPWPPNCPTMPGPLPGRDQAGRRQATRSVARSDRPNRRIDSIMTASAVL